MHGRTESAVAALHSARSCSAVAGPGTARPWFDGERRCPELRAGADRGRLVSEQKHYLPQAAN